MVKIDIVGSLEYGTPFLISIIRKGNFPTNHIVYADSEDEALDNLAEYFSAQGILASPLPMEEHDNYYYGAGFYPFYLPDVHIRELMEDEVDEILIEKRLALKGIYFYNGFNKPEYLANDINNLLRKLKTGDVTIDSNYLGDMAEDIIDDIEFAIQFKEPNERRFELNRVLFEFNIFINPRKNELSEINTYSFGLDKDTHIAEVFS